MRELLRVEVEPFGITIEGARDFAQLDNRRGMSLGTFGQAGIDFFQLAQKPLGFRELIEQGVI